MLSLVLGGSKKPIYVLTATECDNKILSTNLGQMFACDSFPCCYIVVLGILSDFSTLILLVQ